MAEFHGQFDGLPVPTIHEVEQLSAEMQLVLAHEPNSIEEMYCQVMNQSRWVQDVIDHDVQTFRSREADPDFTHEQLREFEQGIRFGYELAIGSIALLKMHRSGFIEIDQYMDWARKQPGELPVNTRAEMRRIRNVRLGDAIIDIAHDEHVTDSTDIAYFDMLNYTREAKDLDDLWTSQLYEQVRKLCELYSDYDEDMVDESPYAEGFWHGVANALEMYLQSYEEQIFKRYKRPA